MEVLYRCSVKPETKGDSVILHCISTHVYGSTEFIGYGTTRFWDAGLSDRLYIDLTDLQVDISFKRKGPRYMLLRGAELFDQTLFQNVM
jgi:hypothetical protein